MSDKRSTHTDALDTVGMIITPNEKRDAVHFAVEPVPADTFLTPGQKVGRLPNGQYSPFAEKLLGIVDPFLPKPVNAGEWFWLFIFPRQITSLRHVWVHPDFPDQMMNSPTEAPVDISPVVSTPASVEMSESEKWIRNYADMLSQRGDWVSYEELMQTAASWEDDGGYYRNYIGREDYYEGERVDPLFWHHYNIITGKEIPSDTNFFECSC